MDTGLEAGMLGVEASLVIAYRVYGAFGFNPLTSEELVRMIAEKPPAFAASAVAAGIAAACGLRPDQVLAAAIRPLRKETNRNLRRLGGDASPALDPSETS
ncbi:antifreeze protein [Tropicimonas sp.]|uniref:antifreeze protein n=1 Tax=Tropicimonas sp. TaxID=2067044 RepID=UPI003A8854F2